MISEIQIDTLISKNKNCILVVGGEPVITNYTVTFCQNYFQQKDFGIEAITINSTTKAGDLEPIFSDGSLFSNNNLYKITISKGRISEDVKKLITQSIISKLEDFYVISVESDSKDFKKTSWYKNLQKLSAITEANEPNSIEIIKLIKVRAQLHELDLNEEAINLIAEFTEGNLLAAENEIIKLSLLHQGSKINAANISKLLSNSAKYDGFKLLEFTLKGEINNTYKAIKCLEEEGMEPLMINGLYAWIFRAVANIKISNNGQYTQNDFLKLRIFGPSQTLVINCVNNLSDKQIEASLRKIKDIDLICKGLLPGNPWLELNRFVIGLARILYKTKV
ncbi:MAG: DNA polymerase III subunit delta [Methylophilaceae bacterium]|jgi:DNA polymerase-3 subunit delta|nr:DNA polymerase III subunit delta [Methylophilaceae bacterium]